MDYKDYQKCNSSDNFYFNHKNNIIRGLLEVVKKDNSKILNLGCGTGNDMKIISKYGEVTIVDINEKAIAEVPKELYIEKIVGDISKIKLRENYYNIIVAFDFFEHIMNENIPKVYSSLKQGGYLILTVPAYQFLFSNHDIVLGHYRRYNIIEVQNLLEDFKIIKIGYWNFFIFPLVIIYRLLKKNSSQIDNLNLPKPVDSFLTRILKFENWLIKKDINLPFGVGIYAIGRKEIENAT